MRLEPEGPGRPPPEEQGTGAGDRLSLERFAHNEHLTPGGIAWTLRLAERAGIGPGTEVLELASGKGEAACVLAERLRCTVAGYDRLETYVEESRRRARNRGLTDRLSFTQADCRTLALDRRDFDVVLCEGAAALIGVRETLAVARAHLCPGGVLALSDAIRGPHYGGEPEWRACETRTSYPDTLREAGFEPLWVEEMEPLDWAVYWGPIEQYIAEHQEWSGTLEELEQAGTWEAALERERDHVTRGVVSYLAVVARRL